MEEYKYMSLFYKNTYKEITYWEARQSDDVKIDINDFTQRIKQGKYRHIFENFNSSLKREITVFDYHNLYNRILDYLYCEIIAIDLYRVIKGEKLYQVINGKKKLLTIQDVAKAYQKEWEKLKYVFNEFIAKIEKPKNVTNEENLQTLIEMTNEVNRKIDIMCTKKNEINHDNIFYYLHEKGHVDKNKNASVGIEDIVDAIWESGLVNIVTIEMVNEFKQKNGKPFKESSVIEALKRQKPESEKFKGKQRKKLREAQKSNKKEIKKK